MGVIVKVCGITNREDAEAAVAAGADALGFVFYPPSPRAVSVRAAAEITDGLPPYIVRTGVFVDAEPADVLAAARECQLTLLQFHGTEPPEYCTQFGIMAMKAFRVRGPETLDAMQQYHTEAYLLDAWTAGQLGGTGERFDWELAIEAQKLGKPIFLAGGLKPDNVAEAIRRVRPYAVDVSSGVEASPGRKDHGKVMAFVRSAKSVL
jgi:phosphoribosylanthranilate isomerase